MDRLPIAWQVVRESSRHVVLKSIVKPSRDRAPRKVFTELSASPQTVASPRMWIALQPEFTKASMAPMMLMTTQMTQATTTISSRKMIVDQRQSCVSSYFRQQPAQPLQHVRKAVPHFSQRLPLSSLFSTSTDAACGPPNQ